VDRIETRCAAAAFLGRKKGNKSPLRRIKQAAIHFISDGLTHPRWLCAMVHARFSEGPGQCVTGFSYPSAKMKPRRPHARTACATAKKGSSMNTAEAVRLIGMLEEVSRHAASDEVNAGIAAVLAHIRPCIPADQTASFDRYCARADYRSFAAQMEAARDTAGA